MLSSAEATRIADLWRPRFAEPEAYVTSIERYLERFPPPSQTVVSLERWLAEDLDHQGVRAALLKPKSGGKDPDNVPQDLGEIVDDCTSCHGLRWVRRDLPVGHEDFGKVLRCPSCGGRPTGRQQQQQQPEFSSFSTTKDARNRCIKCQRFEDEWATDSCRNPRWHWPNFRSRTYPEPSPVAGWSAVGAKLLERYQLTRQRCDDCSLWEDEAAPDECPRSFWHLPEIWFALHPHDPFPDDLGPFTRGWLRRQRPADAVVEIPMLSADA